MKKKACIHFQWEPLRSSYGSRRHVLPGLHIGDFSMKLQQAQIFSSLLPAVAANSVSQPLDTDVTQQKKNKQKLQTVGPVMLFPWDPVLGFNTALVECGVNK